MFIVDNHVDFKKNEKVKNALTDLNLATAVPCHVWFIYIYIFFNFSILAESLQISPVQRDHCSVNMLTPLTAKPLCARTHTHTQITPCGSLPSLLPPFFCPSFTLRSRYFHSVHWGLSLNSSPFIPKGPCFGFTDCPSASSSLTWSPLKKVSSAKR